MADRESSFVLKFDGDAGTLSSVLASLKSQLKSDVAELERTTSKVELFKGLQGELATARANFDASKAKVEQLAATINVNLGGATKELQAQFAAATKEMAANERQAAKTQKQIERLGGQLKLAGVDTAKLASEEARLAAALRQAQDAATNQAAQQLLGLKTLRDVQPEISRLNAAYNTLRVSGTLSAKEIALAQQQLQVKTAELRNSVTGAAVAARSGAPDLVNFFRNSLLPALGLTASLATVVAGIRATIAASNEFKQAVAEIGTVTNLSKDQLGALGTQARALAVDLGVDINEALKGLFELIRSGVPPENALDVLRISATAAKAALTDVGTGVKATNLLLDSFGASAADLPLLFDKIVAGAHNGGATLKEFAEAGGPLLNVARAAGVDFDELVAVLTVLVDKSGDVGKSFADLTKIIARLDTADVRAKLHSINIEGDSLIDIFRQIGERGLTLTDVLGIDLTGAGGRSAASLATLTTNAKELPEALDKIRGAAGGAKKSIDDLFDSPKARADRFNAAVAETAISIGELFGPGSKLTSGVTATLVTLNRLPNALDAFGGSTNRAALSGTLLDNSLARAIASLVGIQPAATVASRGMSAATVAATGTGDAMDRLANRAKQANADLGEFSARLASDIQAFNAALSRDVSDINARAEAEIAALDRSRAAQAASAKATLDIQLKAAADRLAAITKSEADITAAIDKEVLARTALARKAGDDEKKIAADAANLRIAALQPVLAQYQAHYSALIALSQDYAAKARTAEQARVDIVKAVTDEVRQIRLGELDGLDQFVARQKRIDELISEGRRKAAQGDVEAAKQFFDQAIAESKGLTEVIDQNGVKVITTLQAREARLDALKKISDAANESIGAQGAAAAKGANEAIKAADSVATKIKELQAQYDTLKASVAEGLAFKVHLDQQSVATALSVLDELTRPRTAVVTVVTQTADGAPAALPASASGGGNGEHFATGGLVRPRPFARGGVVPRPRPFAFGGPVFAGPKVPGVGDRDTFPALLQSGSYVIRKRASAYYGDGLMRRVVRGYASGGVVGTILKQNPLSQDFVTRLFGSSAKLAERFTLGGAGDVAEKYRDTLAKLQQIRNQALGLKEPPAGEVGIGEWAALAMQRLPLLPPAKQERLKGVVDESFEGWLSGIAQARRFGVPSVIEFPLLTLLAKGGAVRPPAGAEALKRRHGYRDSLDLPRAPRRAAFAAGGPSSDTVPALLTPGEFVIRKRVVNRLGPDFFARLNRMQVPRLDLAAMFAPPARVAHFAQGGLVGGSSSAPKGGGVGGGSITVNIKANAGDLLSAENVRRFIVPVLREAQRRK